MAEMLADDISTDDRRRVVNAGIRHGRDAEIADMRATADCRDHERDVDRHCDPRRAPRPQSCPLLGPRPAARGVPHRDARHRRDRRRRADRGASSSFDLDDIDAAFEELDARYLAGEAAAHAHTWSVIARCLRRAQPTRTARDDAGLGEHRPPATGTAFAPGDLIAYLRAVLGPHARPQHLHRGCASAERPRSGRHPCGAWDLARGLRRRVAGDRHLDGRRRPDQPLRALRRGRPRRRARALRRTQPAGAAAGKRGKPSGRALLGVLRGPRLGRHGGDTGRRLFPPTIAVGS